MKIYSVSVMCEHTAAVGKSSVLWHLGYHCWGSASSPGPAAVSTTPGPGVSAVEGQQGAVSLSIYKKKKRKKVTEEIDYLSSALNST